MHAAPCLSSMVFSGSNCAPVGVVSPGPPALLPVRVTHLGWFHSVPVASRGRHSTVLASPTSRSLHLKFTFIVITPWNGISRVPCRESKLVSECQVLAALWNLGTILCNPLALACLRKQHQVSDASSAGLRVACALPPRPSGSPHSDAAEPCKTLA